MVLRSLIHLSPLRVRRVTVWHPLEIWLPKCMKGIKIYPFSRFMLPGGVLPAASGLCLNPINYFLECWHQWPELELLNNAGNTVPYGQTSHCIPSNTRRAIPLLVKVCFGDQRKYIRVPSDISWPRRKHERSRVYYVEQRQLVSETVMWCNIPTVARFETHWLSIQTY